LKVEVKELEGLVREVSIELPAETVNGEMEKQFSEVRKKATLKGYRKGKAPMNVIKSNYSDSVKTDVVDKLIQSAYPKAIDDHTLSVAGPPQLTDLKLEDDGRLLFTARVEVLPEIDKVVFKKLEVNETDTDPTDEEMDEFVNSYRKQFGSRREVSRPAQETDVVTLDMEKTADPKLVMTETSFPNSTVDLANPVTVKEFKEALPGMNIGDEKDVTVKYEDDYPDKKFAGAELTYRVKVTKVEESILPEFNDAFAKSTGQAETALELRLKIRKEIKNRKENDFNRSRKAQIVAQVCKQNPTPVQIRKGYQPLAEENIRWNLLFHRLAEQEKIEVSAEDTEKMIKRFAEAYKITPEQAQKTLREAGRVESFRESILEEKTLDYLLSQAKRIPEKK
jgi:trigger factor